MDILIEKTVGKRFVLQMCVNLNKCFGLASSHETNTLAFRLCGHKQSWLQSQYKPSRSYI